MMNKKQKKVISRTCRKCKKVFPVGHGHDARTCGKSNEAPTAVAKKVFREKPQTVPTKIVQEGMGTKNGRGVVKKVGGMEKRERMRPLSVPKNLFKDFDWDIREGGTWQVLVKTSPQESFEPLPQEWLKKYNFISDGVKRVWFNKKGQLHRLDGPAVEWVVEHKEWLVNGKHHRLDGSAVEYADGTKEWRVNGKKNRLDGPAVEWVVEHKEWLVNGKHHRLDGPAVEFPNGNEDWWVNGKRHRDDGPAVEHANGDKEWWVNGKLHRLDGPATIDSEGNRAWYLNGLLHRTDGPAVERSSGTKIWYIYGERHRDDGPAVESSDGYQAWYKHGKPHRLDGPAKEWADDGDKEWWVNGKRHRLDGPAVVSPWAGPEWGVRWWVNDMDMVKHADHPDLPEMMGEHFYLLCTNKNPAIRRKALANPNCPPAYKIVAKLV